MKKTIKIIISIVFIVGIIVGMITLTKNKNNRVVIYSMTEDVVNKMMLTELKNKFSKYDIVLEFMSSGNMATKIASEKENTIIDIAYDLEYGSIGQIGEYLEDLEYDEEKYLTEFITDNKKYVPVGISTVSIVVNPKILAKKGLDVPKNYKDLLKPEYKNLIVMPNPSTSGTGYIILKSLVNSMGEKEAFKYFDKLSKNLLQFTDAGLTTISMLERGEVAIAFGLTSQAARSITEGHNFKFVTFKEGSPYTAYAMSVIKGKFKNKAVKEVYEYIESTLNAKVNKECFIESSYQNTDYEIPNYPKNLPFADMSNYTFEEKERLLKKWKY